MTITLRKIEIKINKIARNGRRMIVHSFKKNVYIFFTFPFRKKFIPK